MPNLFKRYYTSNLTVGQDVYSMFKWKKVDVNISDYTTGQTLFSATGLEFPEHYSQQACDIIAKMYFRKSGVPKTGHETSLKQVIHRMVNFWCLSLMDENVITEDDRQILYDELAYTMLNQMWAPNSPQWFNTGLYHSYNIIAEPNGLMYYDTDKKAVVPCSDAYSRTQASACFIVGIEDTLLGENGIMDYLKTSSRLFKFGSGIGANWSNVRAVNEKLSSGGKSSGVLSFQKVADKNGGAIKSGGATRRSATMAVLDIDHPEIEDFIRWKSIEEKKVTDLGIMGYDTSISGEAYSTVSGQNVNNSVSIPDSFMRMVTDPNNTSKWKLHGRMDNSVDREVDPKDLWNLIAKCAWECGDPGLQFTDVINEYNTCSNSGTIKTSNPCFTGDMHLLTVNGYVKFSELDGQEVDIINKDGNVSHSKVWCSGIKDTIILKLSNNETIKCTPDHRFMTLSGDEVEAQYMKNQYLMPDINQKTNDHFDTKFMKFGFIQGDGSLSRFSDKYPTHHGLEIYIGEKDTEIFDLFDRSPEDIEYDQTKHCFYFIQGEYIKYEKELTDLKFSFETLPNREFPQTYDEWDLYHKASFLRGCFSANGSVNANTRVSYKTTCKKFAEKLLETLREDFGIQSYITTNKEHPVTFKNDTYLCKESYDINIHRYTSLQIFSNTIGFIQSYKQKLMSNLLLHRAPKVVNIKIGESQKVYDFTEPLTHWGIVEGFVVHNCGEYVFLNDTACNLASINVMKFFNDGKFDMVGYRHLVRIIQYVLEASIHWGAFPTKEIALNSYLYRTTGLGITNLGATLMSMGIPYDSGRARSIAASLAYIMTLQSYSTSMEISKEIGSFEMFEKNKGPMSMVVTKQLSDYKCLYDAILFSDDEINGLQVTANFVINHATTYGFRNAQVTVIAPTGTIAFAMDCISTSIEPLFSHKVFKKVVDGSYISMVNEAVEPGLHTLGYTDTQIEDIKNYIINGDGKIEGAPHLDESHLNIFDTANKCGSGTRYITPEAHIKMVAEIQPHISGAISKTINLPSDATVEDIKRLYEYAWLQRCKGITVYRDGCKVCQPLNTTISNVTPDTIDNLTHSALLEYAHQIIDKNKYLQEQLNKTQSNISRERLPYEPKSIKNAVKMDGTTYHITRAFYDDGRLGEIFVSVGKQGNTIKGLTEVLCILISKCLQYGIPVDVISNIMRNVEFSPNGMVQHHANIKAAASIPDLISKFLDISINDYRFCQVKPSSTPLAPIINDPVTESQNAPITEDEIPEPIIEGERIYGKTCPECGSTHIVKAGTCYYCQVCGASSGCS